VISTIRRAQLLAVQGWILPPVMRSGPLKSGSGGGAVHSTMRVVCAGQGQVR
jgi:hypothetical protein